MAKTRNNAIGPQVREGRVTRGKTLPVLFVLSIVFGIATATQYFAWLMKFHPSLGANLAHIYLPWAIVIWAIDWHVQHEPSLLQAAWVGMAFLGVSIAFLAIARQIARNSSTANVDLHGSARWAELKDIVAAGLLSAATRPWWLPGRRPAQSAGVYVGAWLDAKGGLHYLRHNGPEHVLCIAPTRTGKGVALVLPTLLSWPHSAVITDLKGELWAMTAGWRHMHARNAALRFEPATANGSVCWNPLEEIRLGTEHEVGDVQNMATLVVDPDGKGLETHWQKTSQSLLVGVIEISK